uniref:Uncharacterized protein n=1 Tax=Leersia perrieri TaxID=77586 RepID=A0A0D9VE14_9ORYZ
MAVGGKVVAAAADTGGVARRMWRVVRAVLYMLRRGVAPSGRKLAMDIHLLLHRGKLAGKALGEFLTFHHHHHARHGAAFSAASSLSCRGIDPALAVYEPTSRRGVREVEFSCSNTPFSTSRRRRGGGGYYDHGYDAAYVARVFEMLNDSGHLFIDDDADVAVAVAPTAEDDTAETTPLWTPTSSSSSRSRPRTPFAAGGGGGGEQVDRKADEFIRRFYEQLRAQRSVAATPDYYAGGGRRTPRPLAAGIA